LDTIQSGKTRLSRLIGNELIVVLAGPRTGGNHICNMLLTSINVDSKLSNKQIYEIYTNPKPKQTFHSQDLKEAQDTIDELAKFKRAVVPLHIGTLLSKLDEIKNLFDSVKILVMEHPYDLKSKSAKRVIDNLTYESWYMSEQFQLYNPDVVEKVTGYPCTGIALNTYHGENIEDFVDIASKFLGIEIDKDLCDKIHRIWIKRVFADI